MLGWIESLLFILGLVTVLRGRFKFPRRRALRGKEARILGLTLMWPGLMVLVWIALGITVVQGLQTERVLTMLSMWEVQVFVGAVAVAAILVFESPKSRPPRSRNALPSSLWSRPRVTSACPRTRSWH